MYNNRNTIFFMWGLPCSGKTTYIKNNFNTEKYIIVDADEIMIKTNDIDELFEKIINIDKINKNKIIIIDGVFVEKEIQDLINLSFKHIKYVYISPNIEYSLYNNKIRSKNNQKLNVEKTIKSLRYNKPINCLITIKETAKKYDFINYIMDEFLIKQNYITIYKEKIKSDEWISGGDCCTCWGTKTEYYDEGFELRKDTFEDLYRICKLLNLKDPSKYQSYFEIDDYSSPDYYGGCMEYNYYEINLRYFLEEEFKKIGLECFDMDYVETYYKDLYNFEFDFSKQLEKI